MTDLNPQQQRLRDQFEGLIGAAAPLLDLVLGVGDRISRVVEPEDHEYYPVRSGTEASMLRTGAAVEVEEFEADAADAAGDEPRNGRDTGA
jgi:hypothetical protein